MQALCKDYSCLPGSKWMKNIAIIKSLEYFLEQILEKINLEIYICLSTARFLLFFIFYFLYHVRVWIWLHKPKWQPCPQPDINTPSLPLLLFYNILVWMLCDKYLIKKKKKELNLFNVNVLPVRVLYFLCNGCEWTKIKEGWALQVRFRAVKLDVYLQLKCSGVSLGCKQELSPYIRHNPESLSGH